MRSVCRRATAPRLPECTFHLESFFCARLSVCKVTRKTVPRMSDTQSTHCCEPRTLSNFSLFKEHVEVESAVEKGSPPSSSCSTLCSFWMTVRVPCAITTVTPRARRVCWSKSPTPLLRNTTTFSNRPQHNLPLLADGLFAQQFCADELHDGLHLVADRQSPIFLQRSADPLASRALRPQPAWESITKCFRRCVSWPGQTGQAFQQNLQESRYSSLTLQNPVQVTSDIQDLVKRPNKACGSPFSPRFKSSR